MKDSKIAWTHHTFNPWWGCARVSPGCENCYAEAFTKRVGHGARLPLLWGVNAERRPMSDAYWREPLKWNRAAERAGERARVFCASMADVFERAPVHNERANLVMSAGRGRLFSLIEATPHLDWLLLTKRPQNVRHLVPWGGELGPWPENVWLGVTAEDQKRADERIPSLLTLPARVRFVSHEPALEEIDLFAFLKAPVRDASLKALGSPEMPGIDWVITGGESGPGARPYDLAWARSILAQCCAAGVACFVKQLGARPVIAPPEIRRLGFGGLRVDDEGGVHLQDPKGGDPSEWPEDLRVREWPR